MRNWFKSHFRGLSGLLLILFLALFAWMLFYRLGFHPLINWDEGIYAQVAKENLQNRSLWRFTYFGQPWHEKPPAVIWLAQAGFKIFGVSELGARFFIAVLALGTAWLCYLLAKTLANSKLAGFLTLAALLICRHFFLTSFFLGFDVPLGFFILLAVYAFIKAEFNPKYFYLFWLALALAVMTKSLLGFLPLVIVFLYSLATADFGYLKNKFFYRGLIFFFLLAAPWHIAQSVNFGKNFWDSYLFYHVFNRFAAEVENNGAPFWYYLNIFKSNPLLGLLSGFSFVFLTVRGFRNKNRLLTPIAAIVIFLIFSFAKTKGSGYIAPIYPFLAAMIGLGLFDFLRLVKQQAIKYAAAAVLIGIFAALAIQYNNFKLLKWGGEQAFFDNRAIAQWLKEKYPNTPAYLNSWAHGGPALSYYFGRRVDIVPEEIRPKGEELTLKKLVLHRPTRNLFLVRGYIFITY